MRVYAIGDIHGQLDMLRAAHAWIAEDRARTGDPDAMVVHLGDYVDRGPDSRGVIRYLMAGIAVGQPWRCVRGNHDRMFAMFLADPHVQDPVLRKDFTWLHAPLGGRDTLASYGFENPHEATPDELWAQRGKIPEDHQAFLGMLENSIETEHLFFAHAGIRPGFALAEQTEDDLLWIRGPFHVDPMDHGKLVVHGHTPVDGATHYGNRVNLDTGAGYGRPLTVAVFEGRDCWVLDAAGRRALAPNAG
ncbi:Serine/threonine protein phosphatase-like protein [Candidatus Rhodobacter oscarellae]|uniref:Serine/threonine protein phosphatase-like protein n=1 Tax=Candidatus Rhodobacter oscarellae TaxID=1675527 RepID=A0A0J9GZM3_9RHOB|nr:metallophosphoesterase family protein [Candidatus Rhodobacter lobularis]KMW58928.1 Serine/threonine protein phosphatase-like protein [Candidatus Rhodobacter lobularis]